METIALRVMTRPLCQELFRGWENDPAVFAPGQAFEPYVCDEAAVDRYFDARQTPDRVLLAIMLGETPVGEAQLKRIDREKRECTLSIHMKSDAYKNLGYGTMAERLALRYAFETLGLDAVNADVLTGNARSLRVLEKLGFRFLREADGYRYYRIEKNGRQSP